MIDHSLSVDADSATWEPWAPKVGDRVRVLPRPECRYCVESPDEDGLTGKVYEIRPPSDLDADSQAHRFWVELDEIPESHGCLWSHFSAIELEPLTENHDGVG